MDSSGIRYIRGRWPALLTAVLLAMTLASCAAPTVLENQPEPEPAKRPAQSSSSQAQIIPSGLPAIQYTIQVGAFSTTDRAAAFAAGLMRRGLDAYYFIDEDGLCKVRFERFETRQAARQRASGLQSLGLIDDFFIARPVERRYQIDSQSVLRDKIVQTAGRFIGTPYRWGGESVREGFDCSGLTMTVYRLNGLELPRNSRAQFRAGTPVQRSALQAGDLVFFATEGRGRVSHVGVYTGKGRFIHAPGQGKHIRLSSLTNGYFSRRYMGARRYF